MALDGIFKRAQPQKKFWHRPTSKKIRKFARPGLLQSIIVNWAQHGGEHAHEIWLDCQNSSRLSNHLNYLGRQIHHHDHHAHLVDGHLEHVLHVVLHLPERRSPARFPLPALSHQAEVRDVLDQDFKGRLSLRKMVEIPT